jgi:Tol biopolymer transport system component/predicted Ser/Thr protein kinase
MIGKTLDHYQITEKLGEGGMGVVYKARDTHLDRFIALKVLPPEKVSDPERKRRFIQEAKAASALNHPSIITIYDIDQADGIDYIAMEYVAGKTLDELIPRKGMRLSLALKYAVQIADALARAHGAGIIHRDLKPSNVMVDEHGLVKVLDFGLAKLTEPVESDESRTTGTLEPHTEEGTIIGTVAYMSPEQAEGKHIDTRSDIFSFGSVLYEMLTGQRAFRGDTRASTIASILREEPKPISQVAEGLPRDAEKIVKRCLRKDPEHRFHHMEDLRVALEELKEESDSGALEVGSGPITTAHGKRLWIEVLVGVPVIAAALVAAGWYWLGRQGSMEREASPAALPLTSYPGYERTPSFSPDGNFVAFERCPEGPDPNCDIYIKQIGVEPPFRLTTDPARDFSPAWSPDGQFIAFLRKQSSTKAALMLVPQRGGQERVLEELDLAEWNHLWHFPPYVSWTPDSKWLVYPSAKPGQQVAGLLLISVETLEKRRLTTCPARFFDTTPAFSSDGRTLAFTRSNLITSGIYLLPLAANYAPQGSPPRLVTPERDWFSGVSWTPSGSEIVLSCNTPGRAGLWRMAPLTEKPVNSTKLAFASDATSAPAICQRGNRLAYEVGKTDTNIYRIDLSGLDRNSGAPFKFISSTRLEYAPAYSPDGSKIAFSSDRSGSWEIWVCDRDGSNAVQLTSAGGEHFARPKWSPDGRSITFGLYLEAKQQILVVDARGGAPRHLATEASPGQTWPSWSSDGRSIYFRAYRSGMSEIWKIPAAGGEAVQVTPNGHERDLPQESLDGKFLYFMNGDNFPEQCSIWRIPTGGGKETRVLDSTACLGSYAIWKRGICFLTPLDRHGQSDLSLYDFTTGKIRKILEVQQLRDLEISPDGQTILYTQRDQSGSDLMLVENFR